METHWKNDLDSNIGGWESGEAEATDTTMEGGLQEVNRTAVGLEPDLRCLIAKLGDLGF